MLLDPLLETRQSDLLVQRQEPPGSTSSTRMFIPDQIDPTAAQAGRKPVIYAVVYRVERAVGAVDGDARGRTAQERRLDRIGQGHGREGCENGRMVRDDHRRR
jgi:hypothetical protein